MPLDFKNTKRVGLLAKLGRGHYSPALAAEVRPAEPRIERAQYLKWVRSVFVLWRHFVHDRLIAPSMRADAKGKPSSIHHVNRIGVENAVYLRSGMRDLTYARAPYVDKTPEEAEAIATSLAEPIRIHVEPGPEGPRVILNDGRHRLHAAREAGAKNIRAQIVTYGPKGGVLNTEHATVSIAAKIPEPINARLLEADWDQLIDASGLPGLLDRISRSLAARNQNYFSQILRTPPPKIGTQADMISQFREENIGLIKSVGRDQIGQINGILAEANARGARHEEIADLISDRVGVSESRAKLIARDQTLKYNSSIHTAQAAAAGIESFTWSTSHDGAVRLTHRELDGKKFRYDDPPVTNDDGDRNLPGEDFQCRCVAIPVIDLFAGIDDAET